jgi:hypothetical protein
MQMSSLVTITDGCRQMVVVVVVVMVVVVHAICRNFAFATAIAD